MARLSFSQRMGITPAEPPLQVDSLDENTKMDIWNSIHMFFYSTICKGNDHIEDQSSDVYCFCTKLWMYSLHKDLSQLDYLSELENEIHKYIFSKHTTWYQILDLCEEILQESVVFNDLFQRALNQTFIRCHVGYRVVGNEICPITSETELQAIDTALNLPDRFAGARKHLQTALQLFSDRENPDYRNSIKESISAVESVCMVLINNSSASLGDALKLLEKKGIEIHPCLKIGLSKLYGYTSDEGGIRHAMIEEGSSVSQEDALFMLVSCSAFCHYLQQKGSKAGIV
nr:hypothetical protein [uncultured Gemmiger sp.]